MYKRAVFVILAVISILVCTGCNTIKNAVTASPDLNDPFSCNITVGLNEKTEFVGTMSRYGTGIWEMDLMEPETVAGLHLTYNDSGVNVSLGELGFDIPTEKINDGAVFELIFNAIDNCAALPEINLTETETGAQYTGEIAQCSYILTFNKDTMELTGIAFPDLNIAAEITGFCNIAAAPDSTVEETTAPSEEPIVTSAVTPTEPVVTTVPTETMATTTTTAE